MNIRPLDPADAPYALASWRESHKQAPGVDKVPWGYYKSEYGAMFQRLLGDPRTIALGAYSDAGDLLGFVVYTPGKRVHTLHWVQTKFALDGAPLRRQGIMTALLNTAELGSRFVYTLRGARRKVTLSDGSKTRSLDEALVAALARRGVTATYVDLKEWFR